MKKAILILLSLGFFTSGFSQTNGNYNYSIAARGFSIIQLPKIFNQTDQRYIHTSFSGGMLKVNDNQISYRISGHYLEKSLDFYNDCINCELVKGNVSDYAVKLGFEKNFSYSRIQPYFAFDAGFRSTTYKGLTDNVNTLKVAAVQQKIESTKNGFVASPVLGIKLNPVEMISIFAESSLDFLYGYERQTTVTQDAQNTQGFRKFYKAEFLLNPISIGIQIHLGRKD